MFHFFVALALAFSFPQVRSYGALPGTLQIWIDFEQKRLNRTVDLQKIHKITVGQQNPKYQPDTAEWFEIESMWVPEHELNVALIETMIPADLWPDLHKTVAGKKFFRFFIHPESKILYRQWLEKYPLLKEHRATATSSSRTLLVQSISNPNAIYFAKVSLDLILSGALRTIPKSEVVSSVGTTQYFLSQLQQQESLKQSGFQIIPEVLGVSLKGFSRGGMLIRLVPEEVLTGKAIFVPLFSLYSVKDGKSLIQELSQHAGIDPVSFVRHSILKPFAKSWVEWAVKGSFVTEAHAQNIVMKLNPDFTFESQFYLRDGGGMYINPHTPFQENSALAHLPVFTNFHWDYQKFAAVAENQSLETYFVGGFLYNVDLHLARIDRKYKKGSIISAFWKNIEEEIQFLLGDPLLTYPRKMLQEKMAEVLAQVREKNSGKSSKLVSETLARPLRIGVFARNLANKKHHLDQLSAFRQKHQIDVIYLLKPIIWPWASMGLEAEISKNEGLLLLQHTLGYEDALRKLRSKFDSDTQFVKIEMDDTSIDSRSLFRVASPHSVNCNHHLKSI